MIFLQSKLGLATWDIAGGEDEPGRCKVGLTERMKGGNHICGQVNRHHKEEECICIWSR